MIEFFNELHLGDNVFHLTFLRKLSDLTNDTFVYYVNPSYLIELHKHIVGYENRIILKSLSQRTPSAINAWIGEIYYTHPLNYIYDTFYVDWFNHLTMKIYGKQMNIDLYSDYSPLSEKVDGYEILVINSKPLSGQFDYDQNSLDQTIKDLDKKYNIITTSKVDGVRCTMDEMMSLVDIGRLSSNSKNVIAIHTGPICCCINKWATERVESWIIADKHNTYSFKNITYAKNSIELVSNTVKRYL